MNRMYRALAAGLAVGALGLGLAVPAVADDDPPPVAAQVREERRAEHQAAFAEALAAELDLDVDRVTEALETVHDAMQSERAASRPGDGPRADGGGPRHGGSGRGGMGAANRNGTGVGPGNAA